MKELLTTRRCIDCKYYEKKKDEPENNFPPYCTKSNKYIKTSLLLCPDWCELRKKYPISKKYFVKTMEELKEEVERQKEIEKGLKVLCPSSYISIENKLFDVIVNMLSEIMGDKSNDISYFIWDCEWGEREGEFCTLEDGTDIYVKTFEELYDYLIAEE